MRRNWAEGKRRRWLAGAAAAALATILIFYFTGLHGSKSGPPRREAIKPAVTVTTVARRDMMRRVSLFGKTVPEAEIDIAAKYTGRVTAVNADLGQVVQAGDVLVAQDTGDLDIAIAADAASRRQAEADAIQTRSSYDAEREKAQADYQRNVVNYNRYKDLYKTGAISRENLDTVEQAMINARATLDTLVNQSMRGGAAAVVSKREGIAKIKYDIEALEKQRGDMILKAPRRGVIGYRNVEAGALVQAGQKLLSLVDTSRFYVDCQVSERDVGVIHPGMRVDLNVESLGNTYAGTIVYVSPASDAATQNFTARIRLDEPGGAIRGGMFARTRIEVLQRPQTIYIPKTAVVEKNGKYYAYVIDADDRAAERTVTVGLANDQDYEILSGLREGETVALTNLSRLKDQTAVAPTAVRPEDADKAAAAQEARP